MADTGPPNSPTRSWFGPVVVAMCVVLAALVLGLTVQNRRLRAQADAAARTGRARPPVVGQHVRSVPTEIIEGSAVVADPLAFGDGRLATIVLFEDPQCDACAQTRADLAALAPEFAAAGALVVSLEVGPAPATPARPSADTIPVYRALAAPDAWTSRVAEIPAILVIDRAGMIRGIWWGYPDEVCWRQVRVTIDALTAAPTPAR